MHRYTFIDGEITVSEKSRISVADRGLTLGDGLFETIRVSDGKAVNVRAHYARLSASLELLAIKTNRTQKDFEAELDLVIEKNNLVQGSLRYTVTRGVAERGLAHPTSGKPTVIVTAGSAPAAGDAISCLISGMLKVNEHSPLTQVKVLNYAEKIFALNDAKGRGFDDAILLNTSDRVVGATTANLFIRRGSEVMTPALADGCLPGTVRSAVVAELDVAETCLVTQDVIAAEELVLTNALSVRAAKQVNNTGLIGKGVLYERVFDVFESLS